MSLQREAVVPSEHVGFQSEQDPLFHLHESAASQRTYDVKSAQVKLYSWHSESDEFQRHQANAKAQSAWLSSVQSQCCAASTVTAAVVKPMRQSEINSYLNIFLIIN